MGTIIGDGITFDDVLLVPAYSEVIPNQVDLTTYLTKTIKLNIPLMSAGMGMRAVHLFTYLCIARLMIMLIRTGRIYFVFSLASMS